MAQFEHCCIEAPNHKVLIEHANQLGAEGWQMVTTDTTTINRIWLAFFVRERVEGEVQPPLRSRMGELGVLDLAGGPN